MMTDYQHQPGSTVLTPYGAGVITSVTKSKSSDCCVDYTKYECRIWRQPGHSITSESILTLTVTSHEHANDVLKQLPCAPGMMTTLLSNTNDNDIDGDDTDNDDPTKQVLVYGYSMSKNSYLIGDELSDALVMEQTDDNDNDNDNNNGRISTPANLREVQCRELATSKCAKFYPLLTDLLLRGETAANFTAESISKTVSSESLKHGMLHEQKSTMPKIDIDIDSNRMIESANKATQLAKDTISSDATQEKVSQNVQQIWSILKDGEMTMLLKDGRERLQHLVDAALTANDANALIPKTKAQESVLTDLGVTIDMGSVMSGEELSEALSSREAALKAIDDLLKAKMNGMKSEDVRNQIESKFSTVFDSLHTAVKSDHRLGSIFDSISEKSSEWQLATGRLMETRAAGIFFEGKQRLQARAAKLCSLLLFCFVSGVTAFTFDD